MSSEERADKLPDGDRAFTAVELSQFDGSNPENPIYVAVKGVVFDVSKSRAMYAPGCGYNVFAGRDASRALALSSVKVEDCIPDRSGLSEEQQATLDKWEQFYRKKYNIIGTVA
ncbi:cytochrome b5-like heme/steroid binding domain-containing protein [Polychytrium aggregatum]|uniref:cytochrome b5-like heme/steroid binding domain-containing protein n=1 Tax=Polychytrium aggregatum TaxID=110093 RepID=UPI0022FE5387|nr:cytochrome b5-like heme/steroid binding domain-containing protein [Polychytrium aggregatum]KAI9199457.1 cytochrome b5-like heme/steroid binding domain-containing protein [Polychytrium aggregatum]